MANLENKRIKDTYEGLIKTNDNNAISSEVELTDGAGNGTGVSVSTDGRVVASGTVSFGSLKDTGENITITKFVDEADGIANNDNDTSIPTVAAVKDYVDSTELDTVTSVNTQTGDVVLDTDDISEGTSNLYYTEARVSANTSVAANTLKNTYPSADATKVGHITVTQAVDLDTLESDVATNNAKTGITTQQAADIATNNAKVGITTTQADAITANTAKISFDSASSTKLAGIETNADVTDVANVTTALNSIDIKELSNVSSTDPTNNQVLQFSDTTNKFEPTTLSSTAPVDSVNTQTGAVVLDTDDIDEGTSNLYYTDARVSANSAVAANTAKVGITTQQASDITTNNAKVGITTQQATDIVTNNAKVGITTQQASDITTNNAKVGITTDQANAITANTAKNSYPTADATKLAGIETGAEVNPTSTDGLSEGSTNLYYTEARVSANTNVAANTLKNSYPTADSTKVGFISVTQAVDLDTMESNIATNNSKNSYPSADATKVGFISVTQAVDLDTIESDVVTNNAKVGITTQQASDITTNNAKISFDSTSSTKLAGIEAGAEVNTVDSVNGQTGAVSLSTSNVSEGTNLYYTDARVTANSSVAANTSKVTYPSADSTKVGFITITQAVDLDSVENKQENQYKIIGVAMDYSNRVLSDSGTAEGTQSIMENIETLILN